MNRSMRIGRIAGTPVSVEVGLAVLATLFIATLAIQGFPRVDPDATLGSRLVIASIAVTIFLLSVLAHELGHATTARRHGVGVISITLSLLGGHAKLARQAPTPRAEFWIAAAGPAVNLAIGATLTGAAMLAARLSTLPPLVIGAVAWLAVVNLVLAVLNLVPAAPLDGGRVLTAALWRRLNDAELARVISGRVGVVLGLVLLVAGLLQLLSGRWTGTATLVVGAFLFNGAKQEIGAATIRRRLQRSSPSDVMVRDPQPIPDSYTLDQLDTLAGPDGLGVAFPVVRWSAEPIGYVVPADHSTLDPPAKSWTRVIDLMRPTANVGRAWTNESIDDVLQRQSGNDSLLVVVHQASDGRVVGTVSDSQVRPLLEPPDVWGRDRSPASGEQFDRLTGSNRS